MKTFLNSICVVALISLFCLGHAYGDASAQSKDEKLKKIKAEMLNLVKAGKDMEQYRTSMDDPEKAKLCEEKMNQYQTIAEGFIKDLEELAVGHHMQMSIFDVINCTSCLPEALESCKEAEKVLMHAE